MMGNVGKLSVNLMLTVLTNLDHAWRLHVNMYNLNDYVCCTPQMKQEFWASFHQLSKFPTNIDRQAFASMCNFFQNKSPMHPYICSGLGYFGMSTEARLSRAMLFQWGLVNQKSPVRPLSAAPASVWRTLWYSFVMSWSWMGLWCHCWHRQLLQQVFSDCNSSLNSQMATK